MKKRHSSSLSIVITLIFVALSLGCRDRQERSQPQQGSRQSNCTKATKSPDGWPMYAKRGGEGEIREQVAGLTRIDHLRTIDGWSLIRLDGTRRTGWVEESVVATCPEKGVKMAPRNAPGSDVEESPAKAPAKAPTKASTGEPTEAAAAEQAEAPADEQAEAPADEQAEAPAESDSNDEE
jgi:hypothetical protein